MQKEREIVNGIRGARFGALLVIAGCGAVDTPSDAHFETPSDAHLETPVAAGEKGCPNGGVEITAGGVSTVVCNGPSGTDDESGEPGPVGPSGPTGPAGEPAEVRTDCTWCTPGAAPSCAHDGVTLQRCVDDGDGCGHWEAAQVCDVACSLSYRTLERDDLGNTSTLESRCFDEGECSIWRPCPSGESCWNGQCTANAAGDCRTTTPCGSGKICGSDGQCVASDAWFVAIATLYTAFDGLTHKFHALDESLSAIGCSESGETYWNESAYGCSYLSIGAANWSQSDRGPAYRGAALQAWYLNLSSIRATGTYDVACGSLDVIGGNRFVTQNGQCSVTLTHYDPGEGGYIQGRFTATAEVKGHDEPGFDSSLSVDGVFRVNANP